MRQLVEGPSRRMGWGIEWENEGKEINGTSHATRECEERDRMWEENLGCTRVNGLELYSKYGSNNKKRRTIKYLRNFKNQTGKRNLLGRDGVMK